MQARNVTGLNESEVYTFIITANNQVGESNINARIMIMTNESCKFAIFYMCFVHSTTQIQCADTLKRTIVFLKDLETYVTQIYCKDSFIDSHYTASKRFLERFLL